MPTFTQENRVISIETPLGADVLQILSFHATEELGRLYTYQCDLLSEVVDIDFNKLVGEKVSLRLEIEEGEDRYFSGYVNRFTQVEHKGDFARYQMTVVPWLWLATRIADCRIFQNKSVPEIIEEVFGSRGFDCYELRLTGSYAPWEYCVQYRETDFNFVSRLMEQEGIYYFFTHDAHGEHTMVLGDGSSAHKVCPGFKEVPYLPFSSQRDREDTIYEWTRGMNLCTGKYVHTDYDFKAPTKALEKESEIGRDHSQSKFEFFDYPGEYVEAGDGSRYAKVRIEEFQSKHEVHRGLAGVRGLRVGFTFTLIDHPRESANQEYLIVAMDHTAASDPLRSGASESEGRYECSLTVVPSGTPYRVARTTAKPIISGPQTAVVTGPGGEEIYTDEYGRVKVHFHWHRHDKSDENSSCWIRVSQYWAGKQWGSIHIPRIGQEVICEFLEGDPDRPIITGRVYNGDLMPPYGLPGNKTRSGVKSRSSKGGSPDNFNEIRFEDKKGEEQIYVHAEKNQDNVVENDETTFVGHDRTEDVGNDETITIGHDRTEKVVNNETISIGVDRTEDVGNNEKITIGVNRTEKVGSNENITIGANRTENVGANESITIGSNRTRNVGGNEVVNVAIARTHTVGAAEAVTIGAAQANTIGADQVNTIGANQATTVASNQSNTIGSNQSNSIGSDQSNSVGGGRTTSVGKDDALDVGKKLMIQAGDEIVIKTGKASIVMKKDGTIQIKGKDITINGSGKINVKASKDVVIKGKKILEN